MRGDKESQLSVSEPTTLKIVWELSDLWERKKVRDEREAFSNRSNPKILQPSLSVSLSLRDSPLSSQVYRYFGGDTEISWARILTSVQILWVQERNCTVSCKRGQNSVWWSGGVGLQLLFMLMMRTLHITMGREPGRVSRWCWRILLIVDLVWNLYLQVC